MPSSLINISLEKPYVFVDVKEEKQTQKISIKKCNIFDGRWVYKPEDEANYDATDCPFVEEKMSCHKNGRPDSEYMKWKWEANGL
ncbi:Protein trichome birefringence-like 43 [Bienertia sinuspersici]